MLDDFQDEDPVKNSEFLDEFRQRLNSQPIENLEERKKDISKSQHIFLGTILGVGLAGVASWFILSPNYDKTENIEIPVVRRTNTAIKVQPANPGGMEILNQDKTIYEIVEKTNNDDTKIENLLPPTEEPMFPDIVKSDIKQKTKEVMDKTDTTIKLAETLITKEEQKETTIENNSKTKKLDNVEVKEVATINSIKEKDTSQTNENKKALPKETTNQNNEKTQLTITSSGMWQIQLISSPNKAAMEKSWNDLTKKYNQLKGLPHEIESADLGSKGTFYRLKAGAFSTRGEADKLCNSIKSSGGSCLVKKKQ